MRSYALPLSFLGVLFIGDLPGFAQRDPLELVRGLRNNGLPDLALDYLDETSKTKLPEETVKLLPLEYARTWLELAALETEDGRRNALITQAKAKLDVFISENPNHPLTPQANVELAKLLSLQGKVILTRARKLEDGDARNAEMDRARAELKKAADKYASTAGLILTQIKAMEAENKAASLRRELNQFRLRSMIDQGINLYTMSETYSADDTAGVIKSGDQLKAAKKIFEDIMDKDEKEPLCWMARAWAAECAYKAGDLENAARAFQFLLAKRASTPAASAGIRVARYFAILHPLDTKDKLDGRGRLLKSEKDAGDWLRDYPAYRNSQEGLGARYYLAVAKMELGKTGIQRDKESKITGMSAPAKGYFEDAQKLFKEMTETENEFTERSTRYRSQILVTIADAEGHGDAPPPESLGTFERCYLMAQVQMARYVQFKQAKLNPKRTELPPVEKSEPAPKKDAKNPKKEEKPAPKAAAKKSEPEEGPRELSDEAKKALEELLKKEEIRRFTNAMRYLEHGLRIVTPKDAARDVFSAQLLLVGCYYQLKMYPQAAVLAEFIARSNPKASKAPLAAINAVQCYDQAQRNSRKLREEAQKGDADAEKLVAEAEAAIKSDTAHLFAAAQFMVDKYPTESATDQARHFLGFFLYNRDRKTLEAWKVYAEIKPTYGAIQTARYELANVTMALLFPTVEMEPAKINQFVAERIKEYSTKESGEIWQRSLALLGSTPEPDESGYAGDAVAYVESRAQLIRLYQLIKDYNHAMGIAGATLKAIGKFTHLNAEQKTGLSHKIETLLLNSIQSIAYDQFKANNHAKVAELVNPKIEEIKKSVADGSKEEPSRALNILRSAQRQFLTLALQSSVQDQKIERAGEILDLLEKLGGGNDSGIAMLQNLLSTVLRQIDDLEKENKKEEVKRLKEGFQKLLDRIKERGDKLPNSTRLFLAKGYQQVDAFAKAAELLEIIRKSPAKAKPAPLPESASDEDKAKFEQATSEFDRYVKEQRQVQFLLARSLRLGKNYPEALKVLAEIIGPKVTPTNSNPKDPKDKGWGFASMEVRREKALVLEDMARSAPASEKKKKWGPAVQEWKLITNTFAARLPEIPSSLTNADKAKFKTPKQRAEREAELESQLPAEKRQQRSTEMTAVAAKRNLYFDLFFETTRCSAEAYHDIGVAAVDGNQEAYEAKFAKFAQDFHDFQSRNSDLPQSLKDKTSELIERIPLLKREFQKLPPLPK